MLTISLTSIPPRFPDLTPVLSSLLQQSHPARIVLCIPQAYRRFPGSVEPPALPSGVNLRWLPKDFGPASKLLGALDDPAAEDILYCDDDCLYAPNWAETLVKARRDPRHAVAGSAFSVTRLKRQSPSGRDQVAQGFAGVLVNRAMFDKRVFDLPPAAFAADDVWISGHLAVSNIPIVTTPNARDLCKPLKSTGPSLQSSIVEGFDRASANRACANALTDKYGIWPRR